MFWWVRKLIYSYAIKYISENRTLVFQIGSSETLISGNKKSSLSGYFSNIFSSVIDRRLRIFLKNLISEYSIRLSASIVRIAKSTTSICSDAERLASDNSFRNSFKNNAPFSLIAEIHLLRQVSISTSENISHSELRYFTNSISSFAISPSQAIQQKIVFKYNSVLSMIYNLFESYTSFSWLFTFH